MALLSDFRVILPRYRSSQEETIQWLISAHEVSQSGLAKIVSRYVCKPTRVAHRYHALEDFTHTRWSDMKIFDLTKNASGSDMTQRMKFFAEVSNETFRRFYAEETTPPDEIIHVTCTGYVSPSAAQLLVSEKNWGETTEVTHAYHMGCYAAIPAVKMAMRSTNRIDIVHTELCSLHFNPSVSDPEQLVVQGLFADGFIRYSVLNTSPSGLEVLETREEIIPETSPDMTWIIGGNSMQMTLARDISKSIGRHLPGFLKRMCKDVTNFENVLFAVHPGGPLIIDDVSKTLSLRKDQVRFSEQVLLERGNMSSATIPHIWKNILEDTSVPNGQLIVSLAFGPGLTIAGAILRKKMP
jgi:predicted naringenin-chalcone synthase